MYRGRADLAVYLKLISLDEATPYPPFLQGAYDNSAFVVYLCYSISVQVRDGSNENAPLIGRYCGNVMPAPLTTTGNVLYVKFVSDSSVTRAGFRATWVVGR